MISPDPRMQVRRRVAVVFGTRPEAIKMAPVVHALRSSPHFTPWVVTTGQHREMLDQVLGMFSLESDLDLDLCRHGQTPESVTAAVLERLTPLLRESRPAAVLVQGDTATSFAAALAAFFCQVPVVHLEAGLRTADPMRPYPEEMNRRLTSRLSRLHLAPTATSRDNLLREGFPPADVVVTGNTVIDALQWAVRRTSSYCNPALVRLDTCDDRVLLVTAHRRESWGRPMETIASAVRCIAESEPHLTVVFPVHRNPRVREAVVPALKGLPNVLLTEPASYADFCRLMQRSHIVLTDSGGVQEEAPSLGKPVLVMRDNTERPEAVAAGTVRLVGTCHDRIITETRRLLHDDEHYASMARAINPYGDGCSAQRTVSALGHLFGLCERAPDFAVGRATDAAFCDLSVA